MLIVAVTCLIVVAWVYAAYPAALVVLARLRPRHRLRAHIEPRLSVIVPAHSEERVIARKVSSVHDSLYPRHRIELIVASDGSVDSTVAVARAAGADTVLDLPRVGKIAALHEAALKATGEILVFTDADTYFDPHALHELIANFADPTVGGVVATQRTATGGTQSSVAVGEGLYWRYEQWLRRLEDRVGSTVSACGGLYAIRRSLYRRPRNAAGADDFLLSTAVVRSGYRLCFEEDAVVWIEAPTDSSNEFRRKVRLMNGGLRAAFGLGSFLLPWRSGLYGIQLATHKILRRFVPFFLVALLLASVVLTAENPRWWLLLGPQVIFYACASIGWIAPPSLRRWRPAATAFYFCLANLAAAFAVLSLLRGRRFESWTPVREDGHPEAGFTGVGKPS